LLNTSKHLVAGALLVLAGCSGAKTDRPVVTTGGDGLPARP
jgi:hypothetical protein